MNAYDWCSFYGISILCMQNYQKEDKGISSSILIISNKTKYYTMSNYGVIIFVDNPIGATDYLQLFTQYLSKKAL